MSRMNFSSSTTRTRGFSLGGPVSASAIQWGQRGFALGSRCGLCARSCAVGLYARSVGRDRGGLLGGFYCAVFLALGALRCAVLGGYQKTTSLNDEREFVFSYVTRPGQPASTSAALAKQAAERPRSWFWVVRFQV